MSSVLSRPGRLAEAGQWMQRHGAAIRGIQWVVVAVYAFLILVPAFTRLPDDSAHLWNNLTLAAQFVFWGIWWPFVLLSMVSARPCVVRRAVSRRRARGIREQVRPRLGHSTLDALGRLAVRRVRPDHHLRTDGERLPVSESGAAGARRVDLRGDDHRLGCTGERSASGASIYAPSTGFLRFWRGSRRFTTRSMKTLGAVRTSRANTVIASFRSTARRCCRCAA